MSSKNSNHAGHGKPSGPTKEKSRHSEPPARLKTVIRRLPPNLPEAVFWQSVHPWVTEHTVSWKVFYPGKFRKKLNKENISSRAYLLFKNEENLAVFSREYDGHVFRDKLGNESQAVVEFAPNQKVPPEKKKADPRHATIQQDEDYLSFLNTLRDAAERPTEVNMESLLSSIAPTEEPKTTPLLAALSEQKQAAQEKKVIAESARAQARRAAAPAPVATAPPSKPEVEATAPGKRTRRGKGSQAAGAAAPSPQVSNPPTIIAKPPGGPRGRAAQSARAAAAPEPSTSQGSSSTQMTATSGGPETAGKQRNRPVLGLQSRHLKAALTGAGVQVSPSSSSIPAASTAASTSTADPSSSPVANTGKLPPGSVLNPEAPSGGRPPRTRRGRGGGGGGEQKDGASKDPSTSGGGPERKERKPRPPPPSARTAEQAGPPPPRILSRQEPPPPGLGLGDRAPFPVPQEVAPAPAPTPDGLPRGGGGGRGRGRRGRGQ